ncbi:hypothetical protein WJX77_003854 [Trebouxia sp. C0004]
MPELDLGRLMAGVRSKDLSCKNKLGHPRLFSSLSQQWAKSALLDSSDGLEPLHNAKQAAMWNQTVWPVVPRKQQEKEQPSNEVLITELWHQLAKVDYFSPLLWRVDVYGNVLYRFADAGTCLSWSVDHQFPIARGGLSKMANMRIVQSHAHVNKADSLEFLLTRDMVCTGLSMLDFKVTVKHSLEDLLTKYGKKASALPAQATARQGAALDRQHKSNSHRMPHQAYHSSVPAGRKDVPLGLKATRVAHAAAVSSRVFSPSLQSPLSGQVPVPVLPSRHELDDTLGFVQRQGSFHSEHAIQHLMTDWPPTLRPAHNNTTLPSHRSLHPRDSAHSYQQQAFGSRQTSQTDTSEHQSQHPHAPAAPNQLSWQPESSQHGALLSKSNSARPPLGSHRSIASSALFQTIPVSPRNGSSIPDQQAQSGHVTHRFPAVSAPAVGRQDVHTNSSQNDLFPDRYRSGHALSAHADLPASSHPRSAAPAGAADTSPRDAFQSADSFASEMLDTDVNQTQHWGKSMLAQLVQVPEEPGIEKELVSQQQLVAAALGVTPADAFQSADSFASEMVDTDVNQTRHWGKAMLAQMQQVPEEHEEEADSLHGRPSGHAAFNLKAEGMLPPDQAGPGPHDWLWLPDELTTLNDSPLSSDEDSRPDIHSWLSQQQSARLAKHAQHGGAKYQGQWQSAVIPTSPLNTADSMDSTFDEGPKAYSSLPWADSVVSALSPHPPLPSAMNHEQVVDYSQAAEPQLQPETQVPPQTTCQLVDFSQHQSPQLQLQPQVADLATPQAEYRSPFAHWSSTPILGPMPEPQLVAVSTFEPQHAQQPQQVVVSSVQPQHAQQPQQVAVATFKSQHAQPPLSIISTEQTQVLQDAKETTLISAAKHQELVDRLAVLDSLGSMGAEGAFEAFDTPFQTRQLPTGCSLESSFGQHQAEAPKAELFDTAVPLPVCAPSASLSAPEEALLATMQELLDDAACQQQELEEDIHLSFNFQAKAPASVPADDITFLATAAALPHRAAASSPDPFAPRTPDQSPTNLPPCQVSPMTKFQHLLPSQEEGQEQPGSSFHQLLVSQHLDEQDRLHKFQEVLASQEASKDGKPLTSLAGRVHTMAAQLDILQKRTKELQAVSNLARRVNSPYKGRISPLRGASGRNIPVSPRTRATTEHGPRAEPIGK